MYSDQKIIEEFNKNLGKFYANTNWQREEIYRSFQYRDCTQWGFDSNDESGKRVAKGKTLTVVNIAAPMVRAIAGSEIMEATNIDYVSTDPQFEAQIDIMGDAVNYCQYASNYVSERGIAAEDAAVCGLGATVTYLDMTQKDFIAGVPMVQRVFSGFTAYDNSSRGSQLNMKSRWASYADPVDGDWLQEYLDEQLGKDRKNAATGAGDWKGFLMAFSNQENQGIVDFIYHYFWYEFEDIYDVLNPFAAQSGAPTNAPQSILQQIIAADNDSANIIGEAANDMQINWQAQYWSLDKDAFKAMSDAVETISLLNGIPFEKLEYSKRKGKCYYRAELAGGYLIKKSRSYTQAGHPLNFITGYFDENTGNYYGMMRPLSYIQDYLNITMSDFLAYAHNASHGGTAYIKGAGEAFLRIKEERANEDALTPIPANTEVIPKALPQTPEVLIQFIRLMMELMPRVLGLGQEFFGVITSGDMTDSLFGKVMKQSFAVLENWKNNSTNYDLRQGYIFEDLVRLMADANDGMILPVLSPNHEAQQYIELRKQNLARSYALRVVERPLSKEERQETFKILSQLAPQAQQFGINLYPMLLKNSNLDYQDKQEAIQIANPQPTPPDPMNEATMQANIAYVQGQAKKAEADAARTLAEIQRDMENAPLMRIKDEALTEKTLSETALNEAKIQQMFKEFGLQMMNQIEQSLDRRLAQNG